MKKILYIALVAIICTTTAQAQNNGSLMKWDNVNGNNPNGTPTPPGGYNGANSGLNNSYGNNGYGNGSGGMTTSQSSNSWGWFCYFFPQYCGGGTNVPLDGGLSFVVIAGAGIAARRIVKKKHNNR